MPLPNSARPKMFRNGENGAPPTSVKAAIVAAALDSADAYRFPPEVKVFRNELWNCPACALSA